MSIKIPGAVPISALNKVLIDGIEVRYNLKSERLEIDTRNSNQSLPSVLTYNQLLNLNQVTSNIVREVEERHGRRFVVFGNVVEYASASDTDATEIPTNVMKVILPPQNGVAYEYQGKVYMFHRVESKEIYEVEDGDYLGDDYYYYLAEARFGWTIDPEDASESESIEGVGTDPSNPEDSTPNEEV